MQTFYKLILVASLLFLNGCSRNIDENPPVLEDYLIGGYSTSISTIQLEKDYRFARDLNGIKYQGVWRLQDSIIYLTCESGELIYFKIISEDDEYQLIQIDSELQDPDQWDWSSAMKRK